MEWVGWERWIVVTGTLALAVILIWWIWRRASRVTIAGIRLRDADLNDVRQFRATVRQAGRDPDEFLYLKDEALLVLAQRCPHRDILRQAIDWAPGIALLIGVKRTSETLVEAALRSPKIELAHVEDALLHFPDVGVRSLLENKRREILEAAAQAQDSAGSDPGFRRERRGFGGGLRQPGAPDRGK